VRHVDRATLLGWAALLWVFGLFPWVNWIPGGHTADWYGPVSGEWLSGSAIAIGGGLVLAIVTRRLGLWRHGAWDRVLAAYDRHPMRWTVGVAVLGLVLYLAVAVVVFDATPLLIDEIVQVFQARIIAGGALTRVASAHPEFFSAMHIVDVGGKVYAQFPVGGPAMLALGSLVGAEWLVNPVAGAIAVVAFGAALQRLDPSPGVRLGGTVVFALAPFTVFMSASYMNHVTTLMWLLIAFAALAALVRAPRPSFLAGLGCGLGLGIAATVRPVDAFAFALPAGVWLLARTIRSPGRWRELAGAGLGVALPMAALLWANANQTGDPFLFGYQVLWGNTQALGFHAAPWGETHTPARGLELVSLYMLRLQTYLFETPFPSLLPAAIALLLGRNLDPLDRYLLASGALLVGLYFAYWFDGFYLGPRFMYPLIPVLALWTVRLPGLLRRRGPDGLAYRTAVWSLAIGAVMAAAISAPLRGKLYARGLVTPRWDADAATADAGIHDALILVRESWGAQVLALLWGQGVSRSESEALYRKVDTCLLYERLLGLERDGIRGPAAAAMLRSLLRDSASVRKTTLSPDPTERMLPGATYSEKCIQRLADDRDGFALYPPLILAGERTNNVFARDLHARDSFLLDQYPDRPVYLLKQNSLVLGATPEFSRLDVDSLRRAWGGGAPETGTAR